MKISSPITCGIDFIKITFRDSTSGFDGFLATIDSKISSKKVLLTEKGIRRGSTIKFNADGVGYEGTYHGSSKLIELNFGALREYNATSSSRKRWKLLQQIYAYYGDKQFKITELHFAVDLPYYYSSLSVTPKKYIKNTKYPSTKYFDTTVKRRESYSGKKDSFVIYDKCLKCHLSTPLTRIELRMEKDEIKRMIAGNSLITDDGARASIINKIKIKFSAMIIKKGRIKINIDGACDTTEAITAAMEYIKGDNSLMEHLLSHRSEEITQSSQIFTKFLAQCRIHNIYQLKMKLPQAIMPYLSTLSSKERDALEETISNYYKYDKKWSYDEKFLGQTMTRVRKYKRLDAMEIAKIEKLFGQGVSLKKIGIEFGVSESTISRLFRRRRIRRAFIVDSRITGLFSTR